MFFVVDVKHLECLRAAKQFYPITFTSFLFISKVNYRNMLGSYIVKREKISARLIHETEK